jgi:DNA polymerase elongation subunit (family B)
MNIEGWILDAEVHGDYLEIWIKSRDGKTFPAVYKYHPYFYAYPKNCQTFMDSLEEAESILNILEYVTSVERCKKYLAVTDHTKSTLFRITIDSPRNFKSTIREVEATDKFDLYNIDIPIAQAFFYGMDLFPMSFCEFELEGKITQSYVSPITCFPRIKRITLKDSNELLFYELPPLRIINLQLGEFGAKEESVEETKIDEMGETGPKQENGTGKEIEKRKKRNDRFHRPKINDRLISCRIELIEGYNSSVVDKYQATYPDWKLDMEHTKSGKDHLLITIEEDCEADTLLRLSKEVERLDPDIILTAHGDEFALPYLVARASANNCDRDLYLSRDRTNLKNNMFEVNGNTSYFSYGAIFHKSPCQFYLKGRIHIDVKTFGSLSFSDGNIEGVIEVSRVSRVPIQRLTRITIGGSLQSIQFYVANKMDYLVPPEKKNSEDFQTATTLMNADRGGHIFEPLIGVFERVAEFDFTSMYPMIMVNYNISPDTINCECCGTSGNKVPGLPFYTCKNRKGIIPEALRVPLEKRIAYKKIKKNLPKELVPKFENINAALKWILVVSFGYLGFRNARFGRVEGHQSVCAYSRELLLRSHEIAEKSGFRLVHGIVDSMWLQTDDHKASIVPDAEDNGRPKLKGVSHFTKSGPMPPELALFTEKSVKLAEDLREEIKIPITHDATYKFLVFLPSRQFPDVPVLNHYWGVTYSGDIKVRGIEMRRRDAPKIVKQAQEDIIRILSSASSICEFMDFLPVAKKKLDEYCTRIDSGKVDPEELLIVNHVSRSAEDYKVNSYQAVASSRLKSKGIEIEPGQRVEYIIKDAENKNANNRVVLLSEFESFNRKYDKEKYKELLRRGFQNIIPFDYKTISDSSSISFDSSAICEGQMGSLPPHEVEKSGLDLFF